MNQFNEDKIYKERNSYMSIGPDNGSISSVLGTGDDLAPGSAAGKSRRRLVLPLAGSMPFVDGLPLRAYTYRDAYWNEIFRSGLIASAAAVLPIPLNQIQRAIGALDIDCMPAEQRHRLHSFFLRANK